MILGIGDHDASPSSTALVDGTLANEPAGPVLQRAKGHAHAVLGPARRGMRERTGLRRLHQAGCLKLRFPRLPDDRCEAVVINTAGGIAGGDRLTAEFEVEPESALTVTTQACERVYRSAGAVATLDVRLRLGQGASLAYLPQETILFDGGRLARRLDVEFPVGSRLLIAESVVLGRGAMGETVHAGEIADRWRLRRSGRLVLADEMRLGGAIDAVSARASVLAGARAFSTLAWQGPDPEPMLEAVRRGLDEADGASLVDGLLVARLVASDGYALRKRLLPILALLAQAPLPLVWSL